MEVYRTVGKARIVITLLVGAAMMAGIAAPGTAHHHEHENEPYVVTNQWDGFVECAAGSPVLFWAVCATLGTPNDQRVLAVETQPGLETMVLAMEWEPTTDHTGKVLVLDVSRGIGDVLGRVSGTSPLELRLDNVDAAGEDLYVQVWADGDPVGVAFQQPFTVYHDHFYHEPAPEGYSALPDPHEH